MADALKSILTEAGLAIAPLRAVNTPDRAVAFFRQLGYEIPSGAFGSSLSELATKSGDLITSVQQLAQASGDAGIALALADLLVRLKAAVDAIEQLHAEVQAGAGAVPNIGDLPRRLTDFLVLDYLNSKRPQLHAELHLLGLIESETAPAPGESMRVINWNRFGQFLSDPQRIADDVYQWSTDFDAGKLLSRLEAFMRAVVLPGGLYPQSETTRNILGNTTPSLQELRFPIFQKGLTPETYSQFGITFSPVDAQNGKKKGIALLPYLMGAASFDFDVCDRGQLTFQSSADIKGVGVIIRPPFDAEGILNFTAGFRATAQIRDTSMSSKRCAVFARVAS